MRFPKNVAGHLWTVRRALVHKIRPAEVPPAEPWSTTIEDPRLGSVSVSGRFHASSDARRRALVLVHGLGGSVESGYMRSAAWAAWERGYSVLRLNLRGCDRQGDDIYHAGLVDDLAAAVASPEIAGFDHFDICGFSLGGHVALRWAALSTDPRFRKVAAVCSPLDLDSGSRVLDSAWLRPYRTYLLRHLNEIVAAVRARAPDRFEYPPVEALLRVRSMRLWDQLVVAPRFGFASAEDYYARASVGPLLAGISRPALLVHSTADPMVPIETVRPARRSISPSTVVRETTAGGHMGFPVRLDLGLGPHLGLHHQVLDWLDSP